MWLEWVVTILGLLYIVLIAREVRFGWVVGTVGSALFVWSNIQQQLYMDSVLNGYYVVMGIYGWMQWGQKGHDSIPVSKMNGRLLLLLLLGCLIVTLIYGYALNHLRQYTWLILPYMDALITTLSLLATWMTAQKYIENWILWLVANPLAIILYTVKYYPTADWWLYPGLFFIYTIMSVYGYYTWQKDLRQSA